MSLLLNLQDAVSQGILWGVMVLGVYITFRLLDVADLTVDGSFATGGAVCAVLLINGWNPVIATVMGMLGGAAAGAVTGILHTLCEIPAILAGILTQLALYSINLRIMGKANVSMANVDSIFSWLVDATGWKQSQGRPAHRRCPGGSDYSGAVLVLRHGDRRRHPGYRQQ